MGWSPVEIAPQEVLEYFGINVVMIATKTLKESGCRLLKGLLFKVCGKELDYVCH